jgi:flagella basal body P-ring formation protein FlgA
VVEEQVRIHDICELRGFSAEAEKELSALVVGDSPAAGGSRLVHLDVVRSALVAAGANLAQVIVGGSTQCAISRPAAAIKLPLPSSIAPASPTNRPMPRRATESHDATVSEKSDRLTLRQCVIDHFNGEFARYRGAAEVIFDRTSDKVLDLSGPAYEFRLRRRGEPLGLCPLEVDVLANGKIVQTVPFVVQVAMIRNALVARRTVNLDATITAADVDLCSLTFTRLDRLGLDDAATAIGQRAKKVIPAGALIEAATLESVPLVVRGQLVTLTSAACGVRVVTTGKAGADGRLGELIKVRSVDDKRAEFDAVVVGPGEVRLGAVSDEASGPQLAVGERP